MSLTLFSFLNIISSLFIIRLQGDIVPGLLKEIILIKDTIISSKLTLRWLYRGRSCFDCFLFWYSSRFWSTFRSLLTFLDILSFDKLKDIIFLDVILRASCFYFVWEYMESLKIESSRRGNSELLFHIMILLIEIVSRYSSLYFLFRNLSRFGLSLLLNIFFRSFRC